MTKQLLTEAIVQSVNQGGKAFVPYIMAGDGGLEKLKKDILFLQESGVTAIELGIPFSDPVADGPVIQAAGERALTHGVTLRKVLQAIHSFKDEVTVPLVLMTYLNPIICYGIDQFVRDCAASGVSGIIVPDLPLEESALLQPALQEADIALIPLVSLTSPVERIEKIVAESEGFIYAVTVNGITGVRNGFGDALENHLQKLKDISPVPVLAGFGISTVEQVQNIGASVDGVIVGSAIVQALHEEEYGKIKSLINASKPTPITK
ncbi:tryptophan synthase subunit alpha [Sporosarcina ureilytica]|uniref:Tryptophan synthase alpha chain n=1 Tax=Sporosarcina ureilytica TaxID=298596 RepID=A0A1D8JCI1_9BACL|nr:tryptophan synthase subunit alpha [Sporosarcina ureilytica]AOV06415.1 tryptophan synthase subunit alpha [Sporosarcina ureilytica]